MRDSDPLPGPRPGQDSNLALAHNTPQIHCTVGNFVIAIYFLSNQAKKTVHTFSVIFIELE